MSDFISSIELVNKQWVEAEEYFKANNFNYRSFDDLKSLAFYNWMFQVLENAVHTLVIDSQVLKTLYRAVKERKCTYDRFIPKKEFASENRMNGKDKLYFYFGASYKKHKREAIVTCLKEIRANNDTVSVCKFELMGDKKEFKIIDFTRDDLIPRSETGLKDYIFQSIKRDGKEGSIRAMAKVLINFLCNSVAFEPINKEVLDEYEIKYKYIPFWAISDYLQSKGYNGLLFSSTVDNGGKNLVLFSLDDARYIDGSIETFNSDDFLNYRL